MAPPTEARAFACRSKLSTIDRNIVQPEDSLKAKVYEAIIIPSLTYGSECWAMKVHNKMQNASSDMRMLREIIGVSRLDPIRNEEVQRILQLAPFDEFAVPVFRWFGHVGPTKKRDENNVTRRRMDRTITGTRRRARPKKT